MQKTLLEMQAKGRGSLNKSSATGKRILFDRSPASKTGNACFVDNAAQNTEKRRLVYEFFSRFQVYVTVRPIGGAV